MLKVFWSFHEPFERPGLSGADLEREDREEREVGNGPADENRTLGEKVWVTGLI